MEVDPDKTPSTASASLRHRAEEQQKANAPEKDLSMPDTETLRLLHELQVHQIELVMQNEELLKSREEVAKVLDSYTDLYDFAPVGYYTLDRDGVITAVNFNGTSLMGGGGRSRLLGRRFGLFVAEEDRASFSDFIREVFASQDKQSSEFKLTSEGSTLFVQIEAVARNSGQECRLALIDITGRRCAENELLKERQKLEELNRTLEARIDEAVEILRQKDQMLILQDRLAVMGEMINNIAHQWRQPLNTLGLVIQQLPVFYGSVEFNREFLVENTSKAMIIIRQMSQTIDDFRNFFQSDKEKVLFAVKHVIEHALFLIGKSFQDQRIEIDFQAEGDQVINGYPNEYIQVMLNILMNARDVLVEHNVDDARILIRAFTEGDKSVVTISDNGGGIADYTIDRLFDPYFTTKGPDSGSGIGLFMSKTIIEKNMGGCLTAANTDSGAVFRIEVENDSN